MKKFALVLFLAASCSLAHARDAARDLRRMVGYTIIEADSVSEVRDGRNGEKYVILLGGSAYRVDMLLLEPLVTTDVIVFARRATGVSAKEVTLIRLLIDNEAYDAVLVRA